MLEVKELMVFFENALAVNGLNLTVNKGEIVGIIGSNSAGKTTLMNTLSGLIIDMQIKEKRRGGERISVYGKVLYKNEDITYLKPEERVKMGIVLSRERHPIFPESSVLENMKIAGYLRTRKEIKKTMQYVFELFPALIKLKKRKAGFLSGGEQQMLAIGMALIVQPELLLLDEPLLGLSPIMQKSVVDAIKALNKSSGITVILSEQFARPVLPMIDKGYVVENGMLSLSGTGEELMNNPEIKAAYFGV
ncbi:MAG: ATP-binding cassette domain-containing protein [Desulfobacula sp.]|jgi:branched-chain amino acid transport system ATP-binding protein|uniref:ABC transporter ATP-binding protein n=1 Tax=Desulfobacula sp. TaxID=2593537 RepID=UPI001D2BD685|nr:ATP-binding cassette domain-containing protein [Desulfobacula sp.]MBT3486362.1 ATP-binding cassette domain-containing protein [Desulfobacula sp.]MBT3804558.1 ATP-binding cassette domain-containing protein [Desulfobacula sp.]MBT4026289.1 ATP-binding cassette domain-containing protein [Desulfobacula sp.]MBT4199947.1 ATP-binding cassette domain-containing protein [Desulfobacula sp.]